MSSAPLHAEHASPRITPAPQGPPPLRLVAGLDQRPRRPSARAVRVYALGALVGFLLAALLSAPGGSEVVAIQLAGAVAAAAVAGIARVAEVRQARRLVRAGWRARTRSTR